MISKKILDKIFFVFCLIDMMFLPYFPLITVAYSMPVVFIWWIMRKDIIGTVQDYSKVQISLVLIVLSTGISFLLYPSYIKDNGVYLLEMSAVFLYYIMFKYYMDRYDVDLEKWLFYFVLFVGAFVILYNVDKGLYQTVKNVWNSRMASEWSTTVFEGYRFGFVWMDENNIAYVISTIAFFLLVSKRFIFLEKIIILGVNLLVVVSSMSSGGRSSMMIMWVVYFIYLITHSRKIKNPFTRYVSYKSFFGMLLSIIVLIFAIKYLPSYVNSTVFIESKERVEANSLDSRLNIWTYVLQNTKWWLHTFIGTGGRTMVNGLPKAPHNGHFFWIIAYGGIVYFNYIYIFFRKRKNVEMKNWITLIPFFIGFTINTMVGEPKVNEIIAVLVAYISSSMYHNKTAEHGVIEHYE